MSEPFAPTAVECRRLDGGAIEIRSRWPLSEPSPTVLHWLAQWADRTPHAVFLTTADERGERQAWSYGESWRDVTALASVLTDRGIAGQRVMVISPNSTLHMTVALATMLAGGVYVPVAPQYATPGADAEKLTNLVALLAPTLAYIESPQHLPGFQAASGGVVPLLAPDEVPSLIANAQAADPERLLAALDPLKISKMLLTSGSTGRPKPVAYTQIRMTSNTQATLDVWPFVAWHKPELVDWLPWNHAFGGNANVHLVLSQGGTLHVDEAAGQPDRFELTIAHLRRLRPTFHATVPAGFAALLPVIESDREFREAFFGRLDAMFSAGAGMHPSVHRRLSEASAQVRGTPVPILSGWGATETGPGATIVHIPDAAPDCIGLPLPGVDLRLEPHGDKYELLVRGHGVSDGYWSMPEVSSNAFRDDGFYRSGDAGELIDDQRPELGLRFTGRIADDFKLSNGTWVDANAIRARILTLSCGRLRDVLVVGADRSALVVLAFGEADDAELQGLIAEHNRELVGASRRVAAGALFDPEPQELSAKGQVIRAAVLSRRASIIEELYELTPELAAGRRP